MTRCCQILFCLAMPWLSAMAQDVQPTRPTAAVWVAPQAGLQPIRLAQLDIHIQAQGFVARTTLDLRFDNPNGRVLEGELVFPLAAGQTVAGYALEVDGKMREGVVVDKQTARVAFEDITRQQIDPGLAELTAGNVFRTRLYPIPARGSKRVRLHLVATLADHGDSWRYSLPMAFREPVDRLTVRAEAGIGDLAPIVDPLAGDPLLRFERTRQTWVSELRRERVRPTRELAFRIPKADGAGQVEAVDPIDPAWRSVVAQVDSGRPTLSATPRVRRLALFYDASGSARDRQRERERAALAAYLGRLAEVEVLLVAFRNESDPAERFSLRKGKPEPLLQAIDALPLDGGSSYGAISLAGLGALDQVLIVGDGLSNFAGSEARLVDDQGRRPPVAVLLAAQRADHARLQRLARAGGGLLVDLSAHDAETAAGLLAGRSWRLLDTRIVSGQCRMIAPQAPMPVEARLTVYAQCRGESELRLRFGHGEGRTVERRILVGRAEAAGDALGEAVHQLWAQAWIAELEQAEKPDQSAIDSLGKRYSVVTSGTSLLVLDRIEDYVRYRVEPKEAELREQYQRLLAQAPKPAADPGRAARLQRLLARWEEFRRYHAQDYPGVESLLLPMARAEQGAWPVRGDKAQSAGRAEAEALLRRAEALAQRWPKDGAGEDSRARWEREASALVLAIEALRERRAQMPALATDARLDADDELLEVAEGAMAVAAEARDLARARPAMAQPAPAAPPAVSASSMAGTAASPAPLAERSGPLAQVAREEAAKQAGEADAAPRPRAVEQLRASIQLSGWTPDAPYLETLRASADPYLAHLDLRDDYLSTPSYFLDVADFLRIEAGEPRLALRVLSNLAELDTGNTALLRVLAYRLAQWELYALAVPQFELAREQRPEEPQSHRDLALALARQDKPDRRRAVELLWQVALGDWHDRFPDIEIIALHELNDVLAQAGPKEVDVRALGIDPRLLDPVAVGLRVVLSWDADNTDIDLWVVDPSGDKAVYSQPRTRSGGYMSRDFTGGYGPEVYTIRRPLPGTYIVLANYYGDRRQSLTGPVTIQLEFQTRFGTLGSERVGVTRRLESGSQTIEIGRFRVGE